MYIFFFNDIIIGSIYFYKKKLDFIGFNQSVEINSNDRRDKIKNDRIEITKNKIPMKNFIGIVRTQM
jgi:hypothetical protein